MKWNNPEFLFLIVPILCFYLYFLFFSKSKKTGAFLYTQLNIFSQQNSGLRVRLAFIPNVLKILSLIFILIALARPQSFEQRVQQTQEGVDIMLVLDISLSMMIPDMGDRKNRLEAAKNVVKDFIKGRPQDRIGLIVFSGESFTQIPLTFDHDLLQKQIHEIKNLPEIKPGTAIGVALANATARLKHSPPKSRIIIFLTDGDNNSGFIDPDTALQIVRNNKIKVYTIGIGSRKGHFLINYETEDKQGRKTYQKARIYSHINKSLMKKIASQTGGEFFMAKNLLSLKKIFQKINQLETYKIQINKWTDKTEHFKPFLLLGFLFYLFSTFLSLTVFFKGV